MPRWPAGLHLGAGSIRATGQRNLRPPTTGQENYWRRTATDLHVGVISGVPVNLLPSGFVSPSSVVPAYAAAGPQGAGEQWLVDLVHVQISGQFGLPPLVVQQIAAQQTGTTTTPPPPIIAQAWLCKAGVPWNTGKLLAQTSQGGNDALSVSCPLLSQGEVVAVVWYGWAPAAPPWMVLSGTRFAMSDR